MTEFHKIWNDQCEATRGIKDRGEGVRDAEKLLLAGNARRLLLGE